MLNPSSAAINAITLNFEQRCFKSKHVNPMEVPKFGSFKPKIKAVTADQREEKAKSLEASTSQRVEKRHRFKDRDRDRNHHRRHEEDDRDKRRRRGSREHSSRNRNREPSSRCERHKPRDVQLSSKHERHTEDLESAVKHEHQRSKEHPTPVTTDEFEESNLFIIDRRGDSKNIEYGSLHRYSIPAYRRIGYGNLIGRSLSLKIDREASTEKEIFLMSSARGKRVSQKASRPLSSKYGRSSETRLRFVSATGPDSESGGETDFIELSSSRKRRRLSDSPGQDVDEGAVDYRSIEGKAKASKKPADEDVEIDTSDSEAGHDLDLRARQEGAVLSKKAKTDPSHLEPWLALADHQTHLIRPGVEASSFTTSERRTLAELRLSILNEAGKHISRGKFGRERLLLAMIDEGMLLWDETKLATKWGEVLKECPASILIWTKYMDFIQFNHSSFQYETCRNAYVQWLQILRTAFEGASGEEQYQVSQTQIYALLRFTTFSRDAGYNELAIAIWQVLLELHFFTPKPLQSSSPVDRLQSLEDYWDIETPRIGEESTLTWSKFYETGPSNVLRRPQAQFPNVPIDPRSTFTSFAREEAALSKTFMLPASTEDEDALTDPFRCIMYDDLRSVVEALSMNLPRRSLISAFVHFVGLPPLPHEEGQNWSKDPRLAHGSATKVRSQLGTTSSLFRDAFGRFHSRHGQGDEGFARFVDRVFESLLSSSLCADNDDSLREYHLAFKAKLFPKEAAKAAKQFLKTRSSSLRLYNAFALTETTAGRMEKALGVWDAALGLLPKLDTNAQNDAILLWHSRFLAQIDGENEENALRTLLRISQSSATTSNSAIGEDSSHIQHLRLRRDLESGFDRMVLSGKPTLAVLYTDLLAWLAYLTSDHHVTSAITAYNLHLATMRQAGMVIAAEELLQRKAALMSTHIDRQRAYKPATFQREIEESLQHSPSNSVLLELHARIAARDRLRSLVGEQKQSRLRETSLVQWSFKLDAELSRMGDVGGGTVNTVRATFARALMDPSSDVRQSLGLWSAWFRFELEQCSDAKRARIVFFNGIRAMPSVKDWPILGMDSRILEDTEMRRVWEGCAEKGLRLRVEIGESV